MAYDDYATIQEVRDSGLAVADASDASVQALLLFANQIVEKITKQFFIERTGSLFFEGCNTNILHLPFPVHSVTALYLNEDTTALDSSFYTVYDKRGGSDIIDNRKNPKIVLNNNGQDSIYTKTDNRNFYHSYNTTVAGTWGYVEQDGSTPVAINRAVISIIMLNYHSLFDTYGTGLVTSEPAVGALRRERTDDHEVEFYQSAQHTKRYLLPLNIQNMLMQYRAPNTFKVVGTRWVT